MQIFEEENFTGKIYQIWLDFNTWESVKFPIIPITCTWFHFANSYIFIGKDKLNIYIKTPING